LQVICAHPQNWMERRFACRFVDIKSISRRGGCQAKQAYYQGRGSSRISVADLAVARRKMTILENLVRKPDGCRDLVEAGCMTAGVFSEAVHTIVSDLEALAGNML